MEVTFLTLPTKYLVLREFSHSIVYLYTAHISHVDIDIYSRVASGNSVVVGYRTVLSGKPYDFLYPVTYPRYSLCIVHNRIKNSCVIVHRFPLPKCTL